MQHADIVVVGAGLAGLSCGLELACAGAACCCSRPGRSSAGAPLWNDAG